MNLFGRAWGQPTTFDQFEIQGLVPGADNTATIQDAIDAAPDDAEVLIGQPGSYIISKPLRMVTQVGLAGLGDSTVLVMDAFWYAGPAILTGPIQSPHPHGDPILDDADFSYVFTATQPFHYMPIGVYGCYPKDWTQLNLRMPIVVNAAAAEGTFFTIHGETDSLSSTHMILDISWKFTLDVLFITFWTSAGGVQIESTTDFSADIGTRHMVELDWNGTTLKLLVDGVVEASAAIGGTFSNNGRHATLGSYANLTAVIGGRWIQFGEGGWANPAEFDLGGFYLGNVSKHQSNYTVDWNVPAGASLADVFCMVQCTTDREEDDLIKLVASSNGGYSWMQTRRVPEGIPATGDVRIRKLKFSSAGEGKGVAIEQFHVTRAIIEDITSLVQALHVRGSNTFYGTCKDIFCASNGRVGSILGGGIATLSGLLKFSGADIGVAFVGGGGRLDQLHTYDYSSIGVWIDGWSGYMGALLTSDESTAPGIDPLYGVNFRAADGLSTVLTIDQLDVNVINSDVTIPFAVIRNRDGNVNLRGAAPFLAGLTTPPDYFFVFKNPTFTDPLQVDMVMTHNVPIASHPEKILTPDGPAGRVALTNASVTVTARQAREWDFAGVTFTANRVVTLDDEMDTGIPVPDGTVVVIIVNPTAFGGFTLTVDNHDGTDLHVFAVVGQRSFRFSRTTGNWSKLEAV